MIFLLYTVLMLYERNTMKKKIRHTVTAVVILLFCTTAIFILFLNNGKMYDNSDFNISDYKSKTDKDGDSIDDQTDILLSTREYISRSPKYKSEYYSTGYPTGEYGVCTDVVGYALKDSGYDLMLLVSEDIKNNPDDYDIDKPDINIDFRRVKNLIVYFNHTALDLTTDINDISQWQGGDIIVFNEHIGIVSDKRNKNGQPFVIHHAYVGQPDYEEDLFGRPINFYGEIIGHYRIKDTE